MSLTTVKISVVTRRTSLYDVLVREQVVRLIRFFDVESFTRFVEEVVCFIDSVKRVAPWSKSLPKVRDSAILNHVTALLPRLQSWLCSGVARISTPVFGGMVVSLF